MLMWKYLAILKANMIEGLYRPFSKEPIVWRDTSSALAKSSCLIPLCFRNSSNRFFKISPFLWKVYFPHFHYSKYNTNVKHTFHFRGGDYYIIFQLLSLWSVSSYCDTCVAFVWLSINFTATLTFTLSPSAVNTGLTSSE